MSIKDTGTGMDAALPRTAECAWRTLGTVVYGWTDKRAGKVDREWWRTAGQRFSGGMTVNPVTVQHNVIDVPYSDEFEPLPRSFAPREELSDHMR